MSSFEVIGSQGILVPVMNSITILPFIKFLEEKINEISQILVSTESTIDARETEEPLHVERLKTFEAKIIQIEQEFAERFSVFHETFQQWNKEQQDKTTLLKNKIAEQQSRISQLKQESAALETEISEVKDLNKRLKKIYKQQRMTIKNQKIQITALSDSIRQFRNDVTAWERKISHERFMLMTKMKFQERRKDLFSDISETSSAFSSPYVTEDDESPV